MSQTESAAVAARHPAAAAAAAAAARDPRRAKRHPRPFFEVVAGGLNGERPRETPMASSWLKNVRKRGRKRLRMYVHKLKKKKKEREREPEVYADSKRE